MMYYLLQQVWRATPSPLVFLTFLVSFENDKKSARGCEVGIPSAPIGFMNGKKDLTPAEQAIRL